MSDRTKRIRKLSAKDQALMAMRAQKAGGGGLDAQISGANLTDVGPDSVFDMVDEDEYVKTSEQVTLILLLLRTRRIRGLFRSSYFCC